MLGRCQYHLSSAYKSLLAFWCKDASKKKIVKSKKKKKKKKQLLCFICRPIGRVTKKSKAYAQVDAFWINVTSEENTIGTGHDEFEA